MAALVRGRRCQARVGASGSDTVEGDLLAVRHCAGDGASAMAVRAERGRVAAQWAQIAVKAIKAVCDCDGGGRYLWAEAIPSNRLNLCPVLGSCGIALQHRVG